MFCLEIWPACDSFMIIISHCFFACSLQLFLLFLRLQFFLHSLVFFSSGFLLYFSQLRSLASFEVSRKNFYLLVLLFLLMIRAGSGKMSESGSLGWDLCWNGNLFAVPSSSPPPTPDDVGSGADAIMVSVFGFFKLLRINVLLDFQYLKPTREKCYYSFVHGNSSAAETVLIVLLQ